MYQSQLQEQLTEALRQRDEAYQVLRDLIQEYRTPHELSADEMEEIVDKAEEVTGYTYDPEKDSRENEEGGPSDDDYETCPTCKGKGYTGPEEDPTQCIHCEGEGKVVKY